MITLRSQAELAGEYEYLLRDTAGERWDRAEIYRALNLALQGWAGRVSVPFRWEPAERWPEETAAILLPEWMPDRFEVQVLADAEKGIWMDLLNRRTLRTADGSQMELHALGAMGLAYRILYYATNGPVPVAPPHVLGGLPEEGAALVVDAELNISPVGVVLVGSEYVQYAGVEVGGSTTTLYNLRRGAADSAAASHPSGATVYWCVMAPDLGLWRQLADQVRAHLHELFLADGAPRDRDQHERMVSFYQGRADAFWRGWLPGRSPRLVVEDEPVWMWSEGA